jgi:CRP-like cAMP-binding protein
VFRQGERVQGWYLLLSGEVQLFLEEPSSRRRPTEQLADKYQQPPPLPSLAIVRPGTLFGELFGGDGIGGDGHQQESGEVNCPLHTCSARVLKRAEFVRIGQAHFTGLYNVREHFDKIILINYFNKLFK